MKYSTFLLFTVAATLATVASDAGLVGAAAPVDEPGRIVPNRCPNGVRERREIRTLSVNERQRFIDGLRRLQSGPAPTRYDSFAKLHNDMAPIAHNSPLFLPWHRRMLRELEIDLQQIYPDIMLPYWDTCIDSQAPETSVVFTPEYFGGNGKEGGCVTDGPFANWRPYYPTPNCLRRTFDFGNEIGAFYSPEAVQKSITDHNEFSKFSFDIEGTYHARVHNGIGGGMFNMYSPGDPLFFMHHGMVDRVWWQWQMARPENFRAFGGQLRNGQQATPDILLEPWNDLPV
ncbi:hypothetical protein BDF19DRAFT_384296, partial [Syncephalis fuscata]